MKFLYYPFAFIISIYLIFIDSNIHADNLILPLVSDSLKLSETYNPPIITGMTIHPTDPFQMSFMMDSGDEKLSEDQIQQKALKLIKYFMVALAIPENQMWVNLSPYEKNRIISEKLGETDMGRDMLIQDYLLKQLSSSLMSPDSEIGDKFWDRFYQKTSDEFGRIDVPVNMFNRIWIVSDLASVHVHKQNVFITDSKLKVMLEEDYLAHEMNKGRNDHGLGSVKKEDLNVTDVSTEILQDLIVPIIEREVNQGKIFANLRQIYHAMILATWYKKNLRKSFLGQVYSNQANIEKFELNDKDTKLKIYKQYVELFKSGVYDILQEEYNPILQKIVSKKYFSGGVNISKVNFKSEFNSSKTYSNHYESLMPFENKALFVNNQLNSDGIVLVHAMRGLQEDGKLYPNNYFSVDRDRHELLRNPRNIVEFSWNGVIDIWSGYEFFVLIPLNLMEDGSIRNLWFNSTSHLGVVEIPSGSTILIANSYELDESISEMYKERNINVVRFNSSEDNTNMVHDTLNRLGYKPMKLEHTPNRFEISTWVDLEKNKDLTQVQVVSAEDSGSQFNLFEAINNLSSKLNVQAQRPTDYDLGYLTLAVEGIHKWIMVDRMETESPIKYLQMFDILLDRYKESIKFLKHVDSDTYKRLFYFLDFNRWLYATILDTKIHLWVNSLKSQSKVDDRSFLFNFIDPYDKNLKRKKDFINKIKDELGINLGEHDIQEKEEFITWLNLIAENYERKYFSEPNDIIQYLLNKGSSDYKVGGIDFNSKSLNIKHDKILSPIWRPDKPTALSPNQISLKMESTFNKQISQWVIKLNFFVPNLSIVH